MQRVFMLVLLLALSFVVGCDGGDTQARPGETTNRPSDTNNPPPAARSRVTSDSLYSEALHTTMGFDIYLPAGYDGNTRYPVLYTLYGYGGDQHSMLGGFMAINVDAERLIAARRIKPLIIVAPDYDNSFGVNTTVQQASNAAGGSIGMYRDYLTKELIPYVDSRYSTIQQREGRFVEGYSMGGFAALHLAFLEPALFSRVAVHSAALWDYSASDLFIGQRDWLYPTPELRAQRDPFLLARTQDLRELRVHVDVGLGDSLLGVNDRFYRSLLDLGISARWRSDSGGHNREYWNANVEATLIFFDDP